MACKAILFNDPEIYHKVLNTPDDMAKVKALGREVKNFSDEVWNRHREEIVLNGNLAKFRDERNRALKERLLRTGEKVLVEASPRDRIWGVGFGAQRALEVKHRWGLNLLGIALMQTRQRLREEDRRNEGPGEGRDSSESAMAVDHDYYVESSGRL